MSLLIGHWGKVLVLSAAVFALLTLSRDFRSRPGSAAPLLEASAVRELCERSSYPEERFWERARIMGAAGAVFRPVPLERYLRSGEALLFSEEEIAKLRAAGLIDPAARLTSGSIWIKDGALLRRMEADAEARGIRLSTRRYRDMHVAEPPQGIGAGGLLTGFDLPAVKMVRAAGLRPVFAAGSASELRLVPESEASPVLLLGPGLAEEGGGIPILRERLGSADAWAAIGNGGGGRLLRQLDVPLSRVMPARSVELSGGLNGALAASKRMGAGVLIIGLDADRGVEEDLSALRGILRGLRAHRVGPAFQARSLDARVPSVPESLLRRAAALLIVCVGPILALRSGIRVLRAMSLSGRLPEASPFREGLSAAAAAAGAAALWGAAAYALQAMGEWRFLGSAAVWVKASGAGCLVLGAAALFLPEPAQLRRAGRKQAAGAAGFLLAAVFAAVVLLSPRVLLDWGPRSWLEAVSSRLPSLWWAPERWSEIFVGYPCLFVAFCLFFGRLRSPKGKGPDPRRWLFLGLFGPLGTISALAAVQVPFETVLLHSPLACVGGSVLGLLLLAFRQGLEKAAFLRSDAR